ncbi:hypothetical protein F5888DRAFT_1630257 [Russula emetica]|nr:hypothetical protein F5888DRAFT_1630257 [Russula emetica]
MRRRVTRRTVASSIYDDEEEGCMTGSGEYDELYELTKIRVKIHCEGDIRERGKIRDRERGMLARALRTAVPRTRVPREIKRERARKREKRKGNTLDSHLLE